MSWSELDIPRGSALEADLMLLKTRVKQVVKWYIFALFATFLWMSVSWNITPYPLDVLNSFLYPPALHDTIPCPYPGPSRQAACRRTFTFQFGEGDSVISDLTHYARAAALARRLNYRVLIDDSKWKYGRLNDYFEMPEPECETRDQSNSIHKAIMGNEGWESEPHIIADNTIDLDKIFTKGMSIKNISMEDKFVMLDNPSNKRILKMKPAGSWWSDEMVFEEIRRVWRPNKRMRAQVLHMVWLMQSSEKLASPPQRLWLARPGRASYFQKRKTVTLLPYYQNINEDCKEITRPLKTERTTRDSLSFSHNNAYSPSSMLVVLLCDTQTSKLVEDQKDEFTQYATSRVITTPLVDYKRYSRNKVNITMGVDLGEQTDMVIRDLIYANESSAQIICHTADVQCRFLLLLSQFRF
ncbi:hypothetical protein DFH28DRAFT_452612 [Melampsora americana]|nr:hypothetical protein DFH28DRAFT_452612 [Melampsora americana]